MGLEITASNKGMGIMNSLATRNTDIVEGSLSDICRRDGLDLANVFLGVKAVILLDSSGSMQAMDAIHPETEKIVSRHDAAEAHVRILQRKYQGQIALVSFSTYPVFCPGGIPERIDGSTEMGKALQFIKPADGIKDIEIFLVSDGEPTDSPGFAMEVAQSFNNPINTIFVGYQGDPGEEFLKMLSAATGGGHNVTPNCDINTPVIALLERFV